MEVDISAFSNQYEVRLLTDADVPRIYSLCRRNPLFYQHCPPFVTEESIREDMAALPPGKTAEDKYYIGYFASGELVAVMDFIKGYPNADTAFIGFFMTDVSIQSKGIGSILISDLCAYLKTIGFSAIRLGWVKGNPQSEHFWLKNRFSKTGITYETNGYTVVVAQRTL